MPASTLRCCRGCLAGAALWWACAAVMAAPPAAGRYAAHWCVALPNAEADCGPVQVQWGNGQARVRISDIVYFLRLRTRLVDVVLKHGTMQIDAFTANYEWDDTILRFVDVDKKVRYELRTPTTLIGQAASSPAARR